uniref:Uncharacterized protein n=1 Tax=Anguilla anguilla TaxID=7936 RepID=A0A0E9SQR4_ANGAN
MKHLTQLLTSSFWIDLKIL